MTKKSEGLVFVQGFVMESDFARKLTDDAVFILGHLKRKGVAIFEVGDSPTSRATIAQLKKIAEDNPFHIFQQDAYSYVVVSRRDEFLISLY